MQNEDREYKRKVKSNLFIWQLEDKILKEEASSRGARDPYPQNKLVSTLGHAQEDGEN